MEITIKQFSELLNEIAMLRESNDKLWIDNTKFNERTKRQTKDIQERRREIKTLEKEFKKEIGKLKQEIKE